MPKSEFYGTEIFLDNEATQEYLDICRLALTRDGEEYHEKHEVIPPDFFRFLPGDTESVKNMPKSERVYCNTTPEEHWRLHELLMGMFPKNSKQWALAYFGFNRIKRVIPNTADSVEYGLRQRLRHPNGVWKTYVDEILKYHPEQLNDFN